MTELPVSEIVRRRLVDLGFEVATGHHAATLATDPSHELLAVHPAIGQPLVVEVTRHARLRHSTPTPKRRHTLLAAAHFPPAAAAQVKAEGYAGWIDASGNADIDMPGLRVLVQGQRDPAVDRAVRREASRGWSTRPTGLRVLYALLTVPEALQSRLVDVAHHAGVSTATAQRTLTDLGRLGWVAADGPERVWLDRPEAIRGWLEAYTRTVAPKVRELALHSAASAHDLVARSRAAAPPIWVSGGAALQAYGADIVPAAALVYRPERDLLTGLDGPIAALPPRPPDRPANLFVRVAWWGAESYPSGPVPPLLAYADALTSGEPRLVAAAREVLDADPDLRSALAG